ncbi:glycoside hydrolase family 76 protein [Desertivirga brevis]|uniref:glycoside hydrolase family 76 protein n=1 Tax=Desertivirga brevis TaxID=2810310 RepID=UPI001A9636A6|nr:glycoside hydrolase family 76 protein [Pedobacter sp. SYSU D00873]
MKLSTIFIISNVLITNVLFAQPNSTKSSEYLRRAEEMYHKVWHHYRVPSHNLFAENFPSRGTDTLNYFQGSAVKEKEVSFLWPFSGVWSSTNVLLKVPGKKAKFLPYLDSLVAGVESYRDSLRKPVGYQAYPGKFEKADRYYDDNGLVAIDYAEAYLNTKNPLYLKRAKEVFEFILSGWDEKLGGGVTWLEGHRDQKPACSNGMATLAALKIYQCSKEAYYLKWGRAFYDWMHTNLRDPNGVYWNDIKADGKVNKVYYTYNSGSMLEASVLLYEFTKEPKYLKEAKAIAEGAFNHYSAANKNPALTFHIDLPWFVTVLFRGYESLYRKDGNYKYLGAIEKDLNYAWDNSRDKYGFITHSWLPGTAELEKPKWLLDEACIAELYARLGIISKKN